MQAMWLKELKSPLVLQETATPVPEPGWALIELKAAALNRRDYWITLGMYPGIELPKVLGSDGAGIVRAVGHMDDEPWVGNEVIFNPAWNWGTQESAQAAEFEIAGMPSGGTFASHIVVPVATLRNKPPHLDWNHAAALPLAGLTAYRAVMTQGRLRPGEKVLITGIGGGVATLALQMAVAVGAEVAVTSSSKAKIERAKDLGATHGFDYNDPQWHQEAATKFGRPNLIIDSAAGPGYTQLVSLAAPGGRIVNYGATAGPVEKLDMFKLFWNQLHLIGSTMGSPHDFREMLHLVEKHGLCPVVDDILPLDQANHALEKLSASTQFGKVVLMVD